MAYQNYFSMTAFNELLETLQCLILIRELKSELNASELFVLHRRYPLSLVTRRGSIVSLILHLEFEIQKMDNETRGKMLEFVERTRNELKLLSVSQKTNELLSYFKNQNEILLSEGPNAKEKINDAI